jgi:hypothetical protein
MSANQTVRIIAKHDGHLARIIKVSFQRNTVVVTSFQNAVFGMGPRRIEHLTYPPAGNAHITTDWLEPIPAGSDDAFGLRDSNGRRWLKPGRPLASFTGQYQIAWGYIFLSGAAMAELRLKGAPRPHDILIEGVGAGGVAFAYSVDLVEANDMSMAAALAIRKREAVSTQEVMFHRTIANTNPNLLICLRGNALSEKRYEPQ